MISTSPPDVVRRIVADLTARRRVRGVTQAAVAKLMGTAQSAVSELETFQVVPRIDTLCRYAEACGGTVRVELDLPGVFDPAATPADRQRHSGHAYLAINAHGGIGWADLDRNRTCEYAGTVGAVVAAVPVVADYRATVEPTP